MPQMLAEVARAAKIVCAGEWIYAPLSSAARGARPLRVDEPADERIHALGPLVDHPMRVFRDALDARVRHARVESDE